jgi:hypothetical protein
MDINRAALVTLAREIFGAKTESRSTFDAKLRAAANVTGMNLSALTRAFNRAANADVRNPTIRKPELLATAIYNDMTERETI